MNSGFLGDLGGGSFQVIEASVVVNQQIDGSILPCRRALCPSVLNDHTPWPLTARAE
jgi:hypothetical protein